jgi:Zn-dependent alcohol dehydrogenase
LVNAYPIIAVDINEESLKLARLFGATHVIHGRRDNILKEIKKMTLDQGARHVMITLAQPEAIELAVQTSAMPGDVYFIGVPPIHSKIAVNPLDIHKRRKLVGNWGGNTYPDTHIPLYWNLYERGKVKLKELITREEPLDAINDGVDEVIAGKGGRCLVRLC